jgi:hypothetical protein
VAVYLREVTVDPGTSLVTQGDNAYELFVIEAGDTRGEHRRHFTQLERRLPGIAKSLRKRMAERVAETSF